MSLSAGQVAAMQARMARELTATCSVSRYSQTTDSEGGWTDTWTTTLTGIACRLDPVDTGREQAVAMKLSAEARWVISLPTGTDVTPRDRVIIGTRTFEAEYVSGRTRELLRRVYATEVT